MSLIRCSLIFSILPILFVNANAYAQNPLARGVVTSKAGEPISGAKIWFDLGNYGLQKANSTVLETETNSLGKFSLTIELDDLKDYMREGHLWVHAEGYEVGLLRLLPFSDEPQDFDVELEKANGLTVTVLDPEGRPVDNAEISPWHAKMLTGNSSFPPKPVLSAVAVNTSSDGKASMEQFPVERLVSLSIKTNTLGNQKHVLSPAQKRERNATVQLEPVGNVRINFVGGKRKYPLTKLGLWPRFDTSDGSGYSAPVIETHLDKPVELNQIVAGRYKIFAICPKGFELIPDLPDEIEFLDGKAEQIDVHLVEPVILVGRIQTTKGQNISDARISVQYGKSRASESCVSNSRGIFQAKVLPGDVIVHVISYAHSNVLSEEHPRLTFEVPEDLQEFAIETIVVKARDRQLSK